MNALGLILLLSVTALGVTDPRIIERYRQMLAANPGDDNALDRLWKIAQADGFSARLLDDFAKSAAKGPPGNQLVLAQLLHRAGRNDDAREAFLRAIAFDPTNPLPHLAFARILPPAEAAAEIEKAIALQPKNGTALVSLLEKLGETWLAAGEPGKAAQAWEKIVVLTPDSVEPHRRLASFYVEKGASSSAATHLDWLDKHGDSETRANALRSLARLHQASGDIPAALAALEKAMALTAADNWLRGELVAETIRLSRRANRLAELETRWKKEAEANPRLSAPWLQLGQLYEQAGNVAAERAVLERVTSLFPADSALKLRLARLLIQTDDLAGAATQLDAAIAARKTAGQPITDLVFERAELDIRRNDPAAARTRVEALAEGSTDDTLAVRVTDFFRRYRMFEAVEQRLRKPGSDPATLADFLFSQHRNDEGRAVLRKLVRPSDPPKTRAEAHERVAGLLKQAGETVAALAELREAAGLQPDSRPVQLGLGDAILAAGDPKLAPGTAGQAAREVYAKAFRLASNEDERAEADLRMFRSYERETASAPETSGSESDAHRAVTELLSVPAGGPPSAQIPALGEFIESLEKQAMHSEGVAGAQAWLRLARWQFWNHDGETAQAAASQAISLAPKYTAPREFAVTIALGAGDRNGAIAQLRQLAKAVPDRKGEFLLQIARIQTQMGQHDAAIKTLSDLEREGVPGAAVELANAQQQAERWRDALATWEQIYGTAKKERRREFLSPLIRVMQRLQIHQRAAEILWSAFLEQTEEPGRSAVLHELIAHCREHVMMNWLLEKLQVRAGVSGDPADATALATALKADGRLNEASQQLEGAARAATIPSAAEADLAREAELRRDFAEAAKHQRARLNLIQSSTPTDWEKLAALHEAALDYAGADAAREEITRRFPRDSDALLACAAYFEKWGQTDRALKIVRGIRGFDPANIAAAATLSGLLAGIQPAPPRKSREATEAAETVLARTPGGIPSDSLTLPPLPSPTTARLQAYLSTFASGGGTVSVFDADADGGGASEREWRLQAIRCLSTGLDASERQRWIVRWQDASAASERLWALYYVGARKEVFQYLSVLAARAPGNMDRRFAMIWCGLRMGAWKELADWIAQPDRTNDELEAFQSALGEWCAMGEEGHVAADAGSTKRAEPALDDLFTKATPGQLWPCAQVLANHHRLVLAVTLGMRAFQRSPAPRGTNGLALANWLLAIGDFTSSRSVLNACAAEPADSLDAPAFAALRTLYLLAPEPERAVWAEKRLADFRSESHGNTASASPIYTTLGTALLHALTADETATNAALDRLLKLRFGSLNEGTSVERVWGFLLTTGTQLQHWNLDQAAAYLWRRALTDEASIQLQGDRAVAFASEIRLRLAAFKVTAANSPDIPGCLDEIAREIPGVDLIRLAEFLQESGHLSDAERIL